MTVKIYSGTAASGTAVQTLTATVQAGGGWTVDSTGLPEGTYTAQAEQGDAAGNVGKSNSRTFTIDTTPPTATITFPANGGSYAVTSWNNGCGTAATGDFCGTAADPGTVSTGVDRVRVSIQRVGDGKYWNGTGFSSATEVRFDAVGTTSWSYPFAASNFPADDSYTIRATALDNAGNSSATAAATFTMNAPPTVNANGPYSGNEGASIPIGATVSSDTTSITWTYAPVANVDAGATCAFANANAASTTVKCTDDGVYQLTATVSDGTNPPVASSTTLTVSNVAASVKITLPANGAIYGVNTSVGLSSSFTDAGTNDTHNPTKGGTCTINWGDNVTTVGTVSEAAGNGKCTGSHAYTASGSYNIVVSVTDDDGGTGTSPPISVLVR